MDIKEFPLLIVLCGLPGSGKTTTASNLAKTAQASGVSVRLIHFDDALSDCCEGFDPETWRESRIRCMKEAEKVLESNRMVILDDTMHYHSMRIQCWKMARRCGACYAQIYTECDFRTCCERNASRDETARVPEHVMDRMHQVFEPPRMASSRYSWDGRTCVVPKQQKEVEDVWKFMLDSWNTPAPPLREAEIESAMRQSTHESWTHQLDLATRKILGEYLSTVEQGAQKKFYAERLNKQRRILLDSSRQFDAQDQASMEAQVHEFRSICEDMLVNSTQNSISRSVT